MLQAVGGASTKKRSVLDDPECEFTFKDNAEESRVSIRKYEKSAKFFPSDRVWYRKNGTGQRQGPYRIEGRTADGKYTLADDNTGLSALDGLVVTEKELEDAV